MARAAVGSVEYARAVRRARSARRLAASPEPEEAARAAETCARIMAEHGLTESDLSEDMIGLAEEHGDGLRVDLARAVAASRGCVVVGKRRNIAFKGRQDTVAGAVELYHALERDLDTRSAMPSQSAPEAARAAWRLCYTFGYVGAVTDHLLGRRPPTVTGGSAARAATAPAMVGEAVQFLEHVAEDLADRVDDVRGVIERLRFRAYGAGRDAGERALARHGAHRPTRLALNSADQG